MDPIWWRSLAKALVLPPTGLLLLALVGLLMIRRRPALGRTLAFAGVIGLVVLSIAPVATALQDGLGRPPVLDPANAARAQAIVVLGGGLRREAAEYAGDTLNALTLERVRYGARVARMTKLPVLVSGGVVHVGTPEARVMRRALEDEFGVPVRWVEDASRNTRDNAQRTAAMLRPEGITRVVLVTHAFDMRRAEAEFREVGFDVVPAPTGLSNARPERFLDWMPGVGALTGSTLAIYEWLGNAVRLVGG